MNNVAVSMEQVSVVRGGVRVVSDVTLSLPRGCVVGLLGPSGCGKSTLIRTLAGVQRGVTGRVTVLEHPAGDAALRHRIGYVTQAPSVYPDLTVAQNTAYFARVTGAPPTRVADVLGEVGLSDLAGRQVRRLSGGQRARASLAAALVASPELLLLDEPTVGLDPVLRRDLWQMFARLAAAGTTLLVSSHVMDEAQRCDRLVLMRAGRIIADTTPAELRRTTGTDDAEQAFLRLVSGSEVDA